jgi:hypothetical protein
MDQVRNPDDLWYRKKRGMRDLQNLRIICGDRDEMVLLFSHLVGAG